MGKDTATARNRNRRMRQESLRELLAQQGHEQHVVEILGKLQDEDNEVDHNMLQRYKVVIDTKLKLMAKYIPDLKSVEHTGDPDNPVWLTQPTPSEYMAARDAILKDLED